MNKVQADVYVIVNEGSDGLGSKRRRYENGGFPSESQEEIFTSSSIHHSNPNNCSDNIVIATSVDSSRVSGSTTKSDFQSQILTEYVLDRYLIAEKKLCQELKNICQDDHEWKFKTVDVNGVGLVKVYYARCGKDFGSSSGDHSKSGVHNLFMDFKKSHLMSTMHIRN